MRFSSAAGVFEEIAYLHERHDVEDFTSSTTSSTFT
jgi:hypothetical protein